PRSRYGGNRAADRSLRARTGAEADGAAGLRPQSKREKWLAIFAQKSSSQRSAYIFVSKMLEARTMIRFTDKAYEAAKLIAPQPSLKVIEGVAVGMRVA